MRRRICEGTARGRSLKSFLGYAQTENTPDHSTVSRTRRLIDLETHGRVFRWMLQVLARHGLVDGKTIGIDGVTLEANAAMRSIVRRDTRAAERQASHRGDRKTISEREI